MKEVCILSYPNAFNEDSDQTAWMCKLIWISAGSTCPKVRFLKLWFICTKDTFSHVPDKFISAQIQYLQGPLNSCYVVTWIYHMIFGALTLFISMSATVIHETGASIVIPLCPYVHTYTSWQGRTFWRELISLLRIYIIKQSTVGAFANYYKLSVELWHISADGSKYPRTIPRHVFFFFFFFFFFFSFFLRNQTGDDLRNEVSVRCVRTGTSNKYVKGYI